MRVYDKRNGNLVEVYDISYDSAGYPHFLIYDSGQWLRVSAKHFAPEDSECYSMDAYTSKIPDPPKFQLDFIEYDKVVL